MTTTPNHSFNASSHQVTFVTAYYNIYEQPFLHRTKNWRFDRFLEICQTGIPICIFCGDDSLNDIREIAKNYPNVFIMDFSEGLDGTEIAKMSKSNVDNYRIPYNSREGKDTVDYFVLMNAKTEFVARVIQVNPFHTGKFAWMDFNLSHVFHNVPETCEYMKALSMNPYNEPFLTFPGCWSPVHSDDEGTIIDNVNWRFCGGFFIGDSHSLNEFYQLYLKWYPIFLTSYRAITWEVNFWAWLEKTGEWRPTWYAADHNDSIVKISTDFWASSLKVHSKQEFAGFMDIPGYYPGSIAYLRTKCQRHVINIRYLNYWILDNGAYYFKNEDSIIRSQNVFAELTYEEEGGGDGDGDGGGACGAKYDIKQIHCMTEEEIGLENDPNVRFIGLEDIRLFDNPEEEGGGGGSGGEIRFSANSVNYSNNGRNRMIEGLYDIDTHQFKMAKIIEPPTDTWIEKNWIPLGNQMYIYSWNPYQIGRVNGENGRLEIVKQVNIKIPLFDKFRGSSIFVKNTLLPHSLIGVVHLSEEGSPRRYYHALVMLDGITYEPISMSELFFFEKRGIEFCIGFVVMDSIREYHFWISRMDREPVLLKVKVEDVVWKKI